MCYVFLGIFGSGGEGRGRLRVLEERGLMEKKECAAGDLGAGSFLLDKKEVPGIGCSREVPTEVLETGV